MEAVSRTPILELVNRLMSSSPFKANPAYKGKWYAPMIDNPEYKGEWSPRKIPNPAYFEDLTPVKSLSKIVRFPPSTNPCIYSYFFSGWRRY